MLKETRSLYSHWIP